MKVRLGKQTHRTALARVRPPARVSRWWQAGAVCLASVALGAVVASWTTAAAAPAGDSDVRVPGPLAPDPANASAPAIEVAPRAAVFAAGDRTAAAQEPELAFGLQSGATPGCVVLPGWQPPALDCTVIAGSAFAQTVTAWAVYSDTGASAPLSLGAAPLPMGARLLRVTEAGETATPVVGEGRVTARLRFTPTADQATLPGEPLVVDFEVVVVGEDEDPSLAPRATIRTRIHVVALAADERLAVAYAFDDGNGDGAWDASEPGLPEREVRLSQADGSTAGVATDAGGRVALVGRIAAGGALLAIDSVPTWRATTPSQVAFRFPSLPWAVPFVRFGQRQSAAPSPLRPRLTTGRGCLAAGEDAVYRVGEGLAVRVRVDGVAGAWVRLTMRHAGDAGAHRILVPGQTVGGEAWYRLEGVAGAPPGPRILRLEAWRGDPGAGPPEAVAECDYLVVADADPAIELDPGSLDLPSVASGGASSERLVVRNIGGADLKVSSALPQGGAISPFAVAAADRPPFELAPGEERELRIVFSPNEEGRFEDYLLVGSNDPDRPLSAVALRGETPGQSRSLSASLAADRGCLETGQEPIYLVDDPIRVDYRVEGNGIGRPIVTLELVDAAGTVRQLRRGSVSPGTQQSWSGSARPPAGEATLRLRADDAGLLASAECRVRIVAPTVRLAGYVFRDDNGNGVWDGGPGGPPVPDGEPALADRTVRLGGPERDAAETDAAGAFSFDVGLPGEYRVEADLPSGWRSTTPLLERVRIYGFPGEQPAELRFGQRPVNVSPAASATPTALEPTPVVPPTATPEGSDCVTRGAFRDLPLGQSIVMEHSPACYRVWAPTRWGGRLRVRADAGEVTLRRPGSDTPLAGPSAVADLTLGLDDFGWFEVIVRGAPLGVDSGVEAEFLQQGRATGVPWNSASWPLSPVAPGPHLFDVPGALARFDARFGLGDRALAWEQRYHRLSDASLWWGHGWGAALAAAVLEQPRTPEGSDWRQDELEGLAAAFFEAVPAPPLAWDWPAVAPRPGADPADAFADDLQRQLVAQVRLRGAPLVADLRQEAGPGEGEVQVQPHVIHAYHSVFRQIEQDPSPGSDAGTVANPALRGLRLEVTTVFTANAVFSVAGASAGDPETTFKRQQEAVYTLRYAPWGEIVDSGAPAALGQDWRSLRLLAGLRPPGGDLLLPQGLVDPRSAAAAFTGADQPRGENPALDSAALGELGLRVREGLRWP